MRSCCYLAVNRFSSRIGCLRISELRRRCSHHRYERDAHNRQRCHIKVTRPLLPQHRVPPQRQHPCSCPERDPDRHLARLILQPRLEALPVCYVHTLTHYLEPCPARAPLSTERCLNPGPHRIPP